MPDQVKDTIRNNHFETLALKRTAEPISVKLINLNDQLIYNSIDSWDSIRHMNLLAELEDTFGITMEMDDIIDFSSYKKGFELVAKYGVQF
jgi:acyl carrier protein